MRKILAVLSLLLPFAPASAADTPPEVLVKSTVEEVLVVVNQNRGKHELREVAEQKVLPHFDFERMTQLAVGTAWRQANAAQQQALVQGFRTLLVNTYTSALSGASGGQRSVEVKAPPAAGGQDEVTVRTVVKAGANPPVQIDYRMAKSPAGWKVFDVVVENLSLVTNYRGTFSSEVARSGIDGLIKALDNKAQGSAKS